MLTEGCLATTSSHLLIGSTSSVSASSRRANPRWRGTEPTPGRLLAPPSIAYNKKNIREKPGQGTNCPPPRTEQGRQGELIFNGIYSQLILHRLSGWLPIRDWLAFIHKYIHEYESAHTFRGISMHQPVCASYSYCERIKANMPGRRCLCHGVRIRCCSESR